MKWYYKLYILSALLICFTACLKEDVNHSDGELSDTSEIFYLRSVYQGSAVRLTPGHLAGARYIKGIVISDLSKGNFEEGYVTIQHSYPTANQLGDETVGLRLKLGAAAGQYEFGDLLRVEVTGTTLTKEDELLTITDITPANITLQEKGVNPLVRYVTLSMLSYLHSRYESTLVSLHADVVNHSEGMTVAGTVDIDDHLGKGRIVTRSTADFAGIVLAPNQQFSGVVGKKTGEVVDIYLNSDEGIAFPSGVLYENFPESFEEPPAITKPSYNMTAINNDVTFLSGSWKLTQALIGDIALRDKSNSPGKQSIRIQQNLTTHAYVQMNFDVPDGAEKVTLFYGKYYTDATSTFRLQYSVDGGTTWVNASADITDMPDYGNKQATFQIGISDPVRFRIQKLGLGPSSGTVRNGRLCLDDIAVYRKL